MCLFYCFDVCRLDVTNSVSHRHLMSQTQRVIVISWPQTQWVIFVPMSQTHWVIVVSMPPRQRCQQGNNESTEWLVVIRILNDFQSFEYQSPNKHSKEPLYTLKSALINSSKSSYKLKNFGTLLNSKKMLLLERQPLQDLSSGQLRRINQLVNSAELAAA